MPGKKEAQAIFNALNESSWMQIIDRELHDYGPLAHDQGKIPGQDAEPGFFNSLLEGLKYTSDNLCEPLSVNFYKNLHKILNKHHRIESAGTFRKKIITKKVLLNKDFNHEATVEKINQLNKSTAIQSGDKQIFLANYRLHQNALTTEFNECDPNLIETLFKLIVHKFYNGLEIIESGNNDLVTKIDLVLDFHRKCQWLHPFDVGQAIIDRMVLAKLLCEIGTHPAIIETPSQILFETQAECKDKLIAGMQWWAECAIKPSIDTNNFIALRNIFSLHNVLLNDTVVHVYNDKKDKIFNPIQHVFTPLGYATFLTRLDVMWILLIDFKADPNAPSQHGHLPLHHLIWIDNNSANVNSNIHKAADLLINNGANQFLQIINPKADKIAQISPRDYAEQFTPDILKQCLKYFSHRNTTLPLTVHDARAENCLASFSKDDTYLTSFKYGIKRNLTNDVVVATLATAAAVGFVYNKLK